MIIKDGVGSGNQAKVGSDNKLQVNGVTLTSQEDASICDRAFNLNTGDITLTTANESAMIYFKNNESQDFVVQTIVAGFRASTGGTTGDPIVLSVIRQPTGGTIISGATNVDINANRNFGSPAILDGDAYKGAEGNTLTGGDACLRLYQNPSGRLAAGISLVLQRGNKIGVNVTPPTGNTSLTGYIALIGYLVEEV